MNCKMTELRKALERAGFADVKTVISSGNAVFSSRSTSERALEAKCERAIEEQLGRHFMTIVRPIDQLAELLNDDPFARFQLPPNAKRNVTFLRAVPESPPRLPIDLRGARILSLRGREVFTYYVPVAADPAFMTLIEKAFGKEVTTRTWETVGRIVKAGRADT